MAVWAMGKRPRPHKVKSFRDMLTLPFGLSRPLSRPERGTVGRQGKREVRETILFAGILPLLDPHKGLQFTSSNLIR